MVEKKISDLTIETKGNIYFDGRVTSRSFYKQDGTRFTIGIITPGTYTFDVSDREVIQLIAGEAEILLPAEQEWRRVKAPDTYEVAADNSFRIRCFDVVEYLCDYYKN
ncbi:pyrimidine/purine nucleoside phosphorylase [Bacilliculturomica massiliensis]|uniref:pyrimidine/purine nucleoside phosphorylase n=1 Tax=Bacilliculturomica massiliensis TaxID=1917867 RepID=UPI001031922C|nr:pyrimidine/purine nucleoside phosphorylase [Bacilliculturomica massiliensis]